MLCSLCSRDLVPIWYGYPSLREILLAQQDKLVLGGPDEKVYTSFCVNCQVTYPFDED